MKIFIRITFLVILIGNVSTYISIERRIDGDRLKGLACNSIINTSNKDDTCRCKKTSPTMYAEGNKNKCYNDTDLKTRENCIMNEEIVSIQKDYEINLTGHCELIKLSSIQVANWDKTHNVSIWQIYDELLNRINTSSKVIKIPSATGNWESFLMKVGLKCTKRNTCLLLKFIGQRNFPLPSTNPLEIVVKTTTTVTLSSTTVPPATTVPPTTTVPLATTVPLVTTAQLATTTVKNIVTSKQLITTIASPQVQPKTSTGLIVGVIIAIILIVICIIVVVCIFKCRTKKKNFKEQEMEELMVENKEEKSQSSRNGLSETEQTYAEPQNLEDVKFRKDLHNYYDKKNVKKEPSYTEPEYEKCNNPSYKNSKKRSPPITPKPYHSTTNVPSQQIEHSNINNKQNTEQIYSEADNINKLPEQKDSDYYSTAISHHTNAEPMQEYAQVNKQRHKNNEDDKLHETPQYAVADHTERGPVEDEEPMPEYALVNKHRNEIPEYAVVSKNR